MGFEAMPVCRVVLHLLCLGMPPSPSTHPSQPTPPHLPNAAPACRRFNDAGIPWEPFHLKREREEGYFDEVSALKWQNPCPCTAPGHCWLLLQMRWRDVLPVGVPLGTRLLNLWTTS